MVVWSKVLIKKWGDNDSDRVYGLKVESTFGNCLDEKIVIKKLSKVWDLNNCTENDLTKQKKPLVFIVSHLHLF